MASIGAGQDWSQVDETHSSSHLPANIRRMRSTLGMLQRVSPTAAGTLATWMIMHPRRRVAHGQHWRQTEHTTKFKFRSGALRLQGYRWGTGRPILLSHGWDANAAALSAFIDPLVERGFSVIAFDAPAHGASEGKLTTMLGFAAAIETLAAMFGPLHGIIGHSLGGAAAVWALAGKTLHPNLALLAVPSRPGVAVEMFKRVFDLRGLTMEVMQRRVDAECGRPLDQVCLEDLAPRTPCRTLVVHDTQDAFFGIDEGRRVARAFGRAPLMETSGLGHYKILHDPEVIENVVTHTTRPVGV